MPYLSFTLPIFGLVSLSNVSISGDPVTKILLLFSPEFISTFFAAELVTKCICESFDTECLIISSTVPDNSPPSICALLIFENVKTDAAAKVSILSP